MAHSSTIPAGPGDLDEKKHIAMELTADDLADFVGDAVQANTDGEAVEGEDYSYGPDGEIIIH